VTDDILVLTNKLLSLETELMVLRAELTRMSLDQEAFKPSAFSRLEGIWGGKGSFSLEEIQSAEIQKP
jgi:hypothetical protein